MSSSQDIPTPETSELVEPMEDVNDVQLPETHEEAEEEGTSSPSPELIPSEQENEESTEPPPQQQKDDNEQEEPLSTSVPDEVVETTTTTSPVQKEEEEVMENKNNDDQGRQRHQLRQQQSLPYHCYEDGKAPPPPTRQNIIFDGALSLDGRSLLIPNRPDGAGSDFDDISSINTDHYHYMTPTTVGANYHPHHPQGRVHSEEDVYPEDLPLTFNPDTRKGYGSPTNPHPNELTVQTQRDPEHGSYEEDDEEGGCVPEWIMEAPQWLKVVILLSGIFLLGAIVMVGVGAAMIIKPNGESTPFTSNPNPDNFTNIFPPPSPPVDIPETEAPTIAPVSSGGGGSSGGGEKPTEPINVTSPPIKPSNSSIVTFYVIAGRFIDESLTLLPDQLTSLPTVAKTNTGTIIDDDDIVMFHLGDWNSPTATSCDEESYQTNVDLFSLSSVPVYFVPGDNEYNGTYPVLLLMLMPTSVFLWPSCTHSYPLDDVRYGLISLFCLASHADKCCCLPQQIAQIPMQPLRCGISILSVLNQPFGRHRRHGLFLGRNRTLVKISPTSIPRGFYL